MKEKVVKKFNGVDVKELTYKDVEGIRDSNGDFGGLNYSNDAADMLRAKVACTRYILTNVYSEINFADWSGREADELALVTYNRFIMGEEVKN